MAMADSDSALRSSTHRGGLPSGTNQSGIWLEGDVLACACPECQAPMAIRLWLRLATCWQCGTTVELTEEQERVARQLLAAQQAGIASGGEQLRPAAKRQRVWAEPVTRPQQPAAEHPTAKVRPILIPPAGLSTWRWNGPRPYQPWRQLGDPTSWLVSLILHMVLIILLGIWMIAVERDDYPVVLAAQFDLRQEGDVLLVDEPVPTIDIEPPQVQPIEPVDVANTLPQIDEPLEEMAPVQGPPAIELQGERHLPVASAGMAQPGQLLVGRDPSVRGEMLQREGGSTHTEQAVQLGLQWIAKHQNSDGSWSLNDFQRAGDCNGQCGGRGVYSDTAGTALALLPFLGAGHTHVSGEYTDQVARGLRWLIDEQGDDGDLRGAGGGRMYAHGQAAIVLCEAYALTRHGLLKEPAQKAIDFIVEAQHRGGGWRYEPGQAGDTSVVGWQLMALRSAQMAYLKVPPKAFGDAARFLYTVQADSQGATYSYMPGGGARDAMTAEGLLCRQYSGWRRTQPGMIRGVQWLLDEHPPVARRPNMYYWYYATQVMHHMGGDYWQQWNSQMREILVSSQVRGGHETGSWTPGGGHDSSGGRLYMTALAVCTLEVYYRHMPLYRDAATENSFAAEQEPPR